MATDQSKYAIHAAAREGRVSVVESLLNDGSGWTPLMIAVSVRDGDAVVDLLLSKGADINQKNNNGQTALHFVASKKNLDVARKLFNSTPPASARVRDKRGNAATALLKNGAETDKRDSNGCLALDLAPDKEVRKYIEREAEIQGIQL
ncbi:ankyrin repeat-containing domain protein [Hypoxylon fragiforme]|uniref:ankyrin repeat-containing domain protein n=1 Tax=Hypoxylon fragiforme TaxID=63214 RepID=UPI0020C60131|nr:ankyrin repeat-containing domain protein [Hypoxylon fragiforme]KAI2607685.1 ankyrin repeat-containing domain protein [Hypoxylon fragiforme]